MSDLSVFFLWHMHQPYYRDDTTGEVSLPWVRLHSTKAYYNMASILSNHPDMKVVFNLVPSLIKQIEYSAKGADDDLFFNLSLTPPSEMDKDQREFVCRYFFMSNWDTMVRPFPGYARLLELRGADKSPSAIERAAKAFSDQDYLDLQVWFNLSWFGFAVKKSDPNIQALFDKGMGFTEAEKEYVLKRQAEIVAEIPVIYKKLAQNGQIEITASPFYHPILPVLCNSEAAKRAMPHATLPTPFKFPEDALAQVKKSLDYFEEVFGIRPVGMWPSEGSVSPEVVQVLAEAGIKWAVTDEGILQRTVSSTDRDNLIYQPYRINIEGKHIDMLFRDRELSDLIGFSYSKTDSKSAIHDFMNRLKRIAEKQKDPSIVGVVLDGENPWEYYQDGGEGFLNGIYTELTEGNIARAVLPCEYLEKHPPRMTLNNLHSGSWIGSDYHIWIGNPQENKAWEILNQTRDFLIERIAKNGNLTRRDKEMAWEHLYQAEGSDWFWWYDHDFTSDNDQEFDRLFRLKLIRIYNLLGEEAPWQLEEPIYEGEQDGQFIEMPLRLFTPSIDGRVTHFYEWIDAGQCNVHRFRKNMQLSKAMLDGLFFGFDVDNLYLRLDPSESLLANAELDAWEISRVYLLITEPVPHRIEFPLYLKERRLTHYRLLKQNTAGEWELVEEVDRIRSGNIIELAVPFAKLGVKTGDRFSFILQIFLNDIEQDRYPKNGSIHLVAPDKRYNLIHWYC